MAYKLPELVIENVLWIFSAIALPAYARAYAGGREALLAPCCGDPAARPLRPGGRHRAGVVARDAVPVLFSARSGLRLSTPAMLIALSLGVMAIAWASGDVFSAMGRPGALMRAGRARHAADGRRVRAARRAGGWSAWPRCT